MPLAQTIPVRANVLSLVGHLSLLGSSLWGLLVCAAFTAKQLSGGMAVLGLLGLLALTVLAFIAATRVRALGNIMHEACHGLFLSTPRANAWLGQALGIALLQPFNRYAEDHASHHSGLGVPELDRDLARYRCALTNEGTTNCFANQIRLTLRWSILKVGFRARLKCSQDPALSNVARMLWLALLLAGLALVTVEFSGLATLGLLSSACLFYPALCVWSDIADHAVPAQPAGRNGRALRFARNHSFAWQPLNLLLLPRNDDYHLVHHLRPDLPLASLAREHKRLCAKYPAYARLQHDIVLAGRRLTLGPK